MEMKAIITSQGEKDYKVHAADKKRIQEEGMILVLDATKLEK